MDRLSTIIIALSICPLYSRAQTFSLEKMSDSLAVLTLTTTNGVNRWRLPYPTYRFATGDVNGDGMTDAMVGVVKRTRFYKDAGRRLFIFKNVNGLIRPLWMGSKLGGNLQDFKFYEGRIRSLETTNHGIYVVAEYEWDDFGMSFVRYIVKGVGKEEAEKAFYDN